MNAVYMAGDTILTEAQKRKFSGMRKENADVFQGVSSGIDYAIVMGKYPEIEKALKEAEIEFKVEKVTAPKAEKPAAKAKEEKKETKEEKK